MSRLLVVALLLVLLLLGCLSIVDYIERSAEGLAAQLTDLARAIDRQQWERARSIFEACRDQWTPVARRWKMFVNHADMRDIEIGFIEMQTALDRRDQAKAQLEAATLHYYMLHIPEEESIRLTNIL